MNSKLLVELIPLSCAELDSVSAGSWVQYPDALRRNIKKVFLFDTPMARGSSLFFKI